MKEKLKTILCVVCFCSLAIWIVIGFVGLGLAITETVYFDWFYLPVWFLIFVMLFLFAYMPDKH